jgi:hypothetical protein
VTLAALYATVGTGLGKGMAWVNVKIVDTTRRLDGNNIPKMRLSIADV